MNILVMLPESLSIVKLLCKYVFAEHMDDEIDLLILKKQYNNFKELLNEYNFKNIYILNEDYYGSITSDEGEVFLNEKLLLPYDIAYFPFNTFKANVFLFGGVLAKEVRSVNSSLYGKNYMPVIIFNLNDLAQVKQWTSLESTIDIKILMDIKKKIILNLKKFRHSITATGERPSSGIADGFPHDMEIFARYILCASYVKDKKILEIGGGLGYGSYLLSHFAKEVTVIDNSEKTVALSQNLWQMDNLKYFHGDITTLNLPSEPFDVIIFMEAVEHIPDVEKALFKLGCLLKKNGYLIISTPQPELFPYDVCPLERRNEHPDNLLSEGIWPWHIHALGEEVFIPLLETNGFYIEEKNYITYTKGYEIGNYLNELLKKKDSKLIIEQLNNMTLWEFTDFGITEARDNYFSAFSYQVIARKTGGKIK